MAKNFSTAVSPKMLARIQALRLMDDDFMTVVFDGDTDLTEFLLRILLSRTDLRVKSVMTQKEKRNLFGRSVRLDIVAEDMSGKIYNIEVQRADKGASPKRVRYNLALLDSHTLKKNEDFEQLPETYIIFINENDYFGLGKPVYEIEKTVKNTNLPFDDGCTIIYVNGSYRGEDAIGKLMHDFCSANADEMNYNELASKVKIHKQQTKGVEKMCRIFEEYGEEVREEAQIERNIKIAEKLILQKRMTPEEIADTTDVPLEQVRQMAQKLDATVMV